MRTTCRIIALGFLLVGILNRVHAYEALQGPTEMRFWDKAKAYNGYTLFGVGNRTYLLDMEGSVVHTWPIGTNPHLLENGDILDASKDDPSGFQGFKEVDWNGKVVWEYVEKRPEYAPHHDWTRIFNKKLNANTLLYIANKTVTREQAIAAGCDPNKMKQDGRGQGDRRRDDDRGGPPRDRRGGGPRGGRGGGIQVDSVVEVDIVGKIVWEWWFFDHVIQNVDATKPNHVGKGKTIADYPGRLNINLPGRPLRGDWLHCNALDYNAELGQIVINSVQGEFYVIDHDKTFIPGDPARSIKLAAGPAGDFLYRFGDPARYGQGDHPAILEDWTQATSGHKQIGGSHDVQWIAPGLPGAGHFLIFNNGQYIFDRTSQSSVLEINGFLDADGRDTGHYVNPPEAGYNEVRFHRDTHKPSRLVSRQIVWSYQSKSNQGFFSHIGSSAQRLPNGNTLICSDTEGHLFEVTAKGELVWEYISPVTKELGTLKVMPDCLPMTNSVFRAYRYGPDDPALKGKDLTPKGTITDKFPRAPDPRAGDRESPGDDRQPRPRRPRTEQ